MLYDDRYPPTNSKFVELFEKSPKIFFTIAFACFFVIQFGQDAGALRVESLHEFADYPALVFYFCLGAITGFYVYNALVVMYHHLLNKFKRFRKHRMLHNLSNKQKSLLKENFFAPVRRERSFESYDMTLEELNDFDIVRVGSWGTDPKGIRKGARAEISMWAWHYLKKRQYLLEN